MAHPAMFKPQSPNAPVVSIPGRSTRPNSQVNAACRACRPNGVNVRRCPGNRRGLRLAAPCQRDRCSSTRPCVATCQAPTVHVRTMFRNDPGSKPSQTGAWQILCLFHRARRDQIWSGSVSVHPQCSASAATENGRCLEPRIRSGATEYLHRKPKRSVPLTEGRAATHEVHLVGGRKLRRGG